MNKHMEYIEHTELGEAKELADKKITDAHYDLMNYRDSMPVVLLHLSNGRGFQCYKIGKNCIIGSLLFNYRRDYDETKT